MPTEQDAVILAAIAGPESGYDYRVINDTPATGDYSVGLFEINYYASLYPGRAAAYGTPRELILSGPAGQCRAAADLWHAAGGFSPWAADIISGSWKRYVGSGPIPADPGLGGATGSFDALNAADSAIRNATRQVIAAGRSVVFEMQAGRTIGTPGWHP